MYTILICDDDRDIRQALSIYLSAQGYGVVEAENGEQALEILSGDEAQLALIDVMMPVLDGIETTARLRKTSNIPVILLTAKGEDTDKVLGLTVGADDYVTKPFNPVELMARVQAQLRRYATLGGMEKTPHALRCGEIALDDDAKLVTVSGESVSLTPTEYNILKLLMENPGKVFSSAEIYRRIWNDAPYGTENVIAVHIRRLREKLEIDPGNPRYLKVVWGHGYKLEV
ncbi:MAG: response regulator transcription factor [Oscillospiraceae bacterium]|nr:response regulator transcription factor [Oscillospiraceae bacterium]